MASFVQGGLLPAAGGDPAVRLRQVPRAVLRQSVQASRLHYEDGALGNSTTNTLPRPRSLSTWMFPSSARTML